MQRRMRIGTICPDIFEGTPDDVINNIQLLKEQYKKHPSLEIEMEYNYRVASYAYNLFSSREESSSEQATREKQAIEAKEAKEAKEKADRILYEELKKRFG